MTRQGIRLLLASSLAFVAMAWALPAFAQNGSITGRVIDSDRRTTDRDNKPLAGRQSQVDFMIGLSEATVTLEFKGEPPKKFQVLTDQNGEWFKSGLPPGTYDISVRREWRDPVPGRESKLIVFLATSTGVVLKPGEKLKLPDMSALTEAALAAGRKPPVSAPVGVSNAAIEAENKRNAELNALLKDANALFDGKKWNEAIAKYMETAAKLEGSDQACARCYVRAGEAYMQLKNEAEAEKVFLKAIELNPSIPEPYTNLATLYNSQRKLADAAKMSAKANELLAASGGGGDAASLFNQGAILWNNGQVEEARDLFLKAVKADPKMAKAQYHLGLTTFSLASSGKVKLIDAKAPLEEYLKLEPTGEFAEAAKGLLAAIK